MPLDASGNILEHVRQALGPAPRSFPRSLLRRYLLPPVPRWARRGKYVRYHEHRQLLLERGRVVWACLVQANSLLFEPGENDSPGVVVYGSDDDPEPSGLELRDIARTLHGLRHQPQDDPEIRRIGEALDDEDTDFFADRVPGSISPRRHCLLSTLLFHRRHFPMGVLAGGAFPILVSPEARGSVMMVPSRYWPDDFTARWERISEERIPKRSPGSRLRTLLLIPVLVKVVLISVFILSLAPSTFRYLKQDSPIPVTEASRLGTVAERSIVEVTCPLETESEIVTARHRYIPLRGSGLRVWYEGRGSGELPVGGLDKEICEARALGWMDMDFKEALRARKIELPEPITLLVRASPPTTGMKIWRIALLAGSALVLYLVFRFVARWFRT